MFVAGGVLSTDLQLSLTLVVYGKNAFWAAGGFYVAIL